MNVTSLFEATADVTPAVTDRHVMTADVTENITVMTPDPFWDDSDLILHPFWQRHREDIDNIPDVVHYALGIYIGIVGFVGIAGNLLVIYIFSTTAHLRTPPNMLIINVAFSDLAFSLVNGFPLMTISCFIKKWMWGKLACELYGYTSGIFGMCSINTLAAISLDRHLVITRPFQARTQVTHRRAALQLVVVWFLSVLWPTPPMLNAGYSSYIPEGFQTSCSFDYLTRETKNYVFNYAIFGCGFCLPVLVSIYCYVDIVRSVSVQSKKIAKASEKLGAKKETDAKKLAQEVRLTKVAAGTVCLFIISWLPYAIVAQFGILGLSEYVTPYSCQIPVMFAKASAMWNPIIYALSHPKFRSALHKKMPYLPCKPTVDNRNRDDSSTGGSVVHRHRPDAPSEISRTVSMDTVQLELKPSKSNLTLTSNTEDGESGRV